ncbi:MAG: gluconate 2-dehydrogenase subunit 3 family protein [Chloroflexota bacterium]
MLNTRQLEILEAMVNRVIPADQDPGGWEGGVGDYLFRQFAGDLKHLLPFYALGLNALDAESNALYGASFDRLPSVLRDELLAHIEVGTVITVWGLDAALWFRTVIEHCAEGYYSDPGNGGNKNAQSWKMIGFEVRA